MKVLFVCVENACRSQMAESFFNHLTKGKHKAFSAGISPAEELTPFSIKVMKEIGVDPTQQRPKSLEPEMVEDVDRIISMGCIEHCPAIEIDENWEVEDPKGEGIEKFREVRDIICQRVKDLIRRLDS